MTTSTRRVTAVLLAALLLAGCGQGAPPSERLRPVASGPAETAAAPASRGTALATTAAPSDGPAAVTQDGADASVPPGGTGADPTVVPAATPLADDRPPAALLVGDGASAPGVAGEEGTFTWDGLVSDAPWVVPPRTDVTGHGPWTVVFDPPLPVERWTVRWARVTAGSAGREEQGAKGTGEVRVDAPHPPGAWSVQVGAWFGRGREAFWYWTVEVKP